MWAIILFVLLRCFPPKMILKGAIMWMVYLRYLVVTRQVEIPCPEFCDCDIFVKMKRAVCQNRRLVSIELNVPPQAEILDVSQNQISDLGDKIFLELGLTNLKLLNISNNMVRHIHFEAFKGMNNVKTLDLSFNAIEYFAASWFESLSRLQELYLKGNKLRSINEQPQINISALKVLDISSCGITSIKPETFKLIPNLEVLDISENHIQTLQVDFLKMLPKLTTLKTRGLELNCKEENVIAVGTFLKENNILYTDSCTTEVLPVIKINQEVQRFQKMVMSSEGSTTPEMEIMTKNSWVFEDDSDDKSNDSRGQSEVECKNVTTVQRLEDASLLIHIIELAPWLVVSVIFAYGVIFGMVLVCCFNLICNKKKNRKSKDSAVSDRGFQKRRIKRSNSGLYRAFQRARLSTYHQDLDDEDSDGEVLVLNATDFNNSTPVVSRKAPS